MCFFAFALKLFATVGDTATIEKNLALREDVVFFGGFEESYNDDHWKSRWGIPWANRANENEVVPDGFQGGEFPACQLS